MEEERTMSGEEPAPAGDASDAAHSNKVAEEAANFTTTSPVNNRVNVNSSKSRKRYSLPHPIPAVPRIPEHLLLTGKRATVSVATPRSDASKESYEALPPARSRGRALSTYGEDEKRRRSASRTSLSRSLSARNEAITSTRSNTSTRRKSLSALQSQVHTATLDKLESRGLEAGSGSMERSRGGRNEDLFLELANDQAGDKDTAARRERASSRLSFAGKRRSLPADRSLPSSSDDRPKTSGQIMGYRASSRLDGGSELNRFANRFRESPSRVGPHLEDSASVSGSDKRYRHISGTDRSNITPSRFAAEGLRSPELPHYGRRRPSFGTTTSGLAYQSGASQSGQAQESLSESPPDDHARKQSPPDSTDVDSDAVDTVWDELDDLKSRIKKLELTGKMPSTSAAAISGDSSERPRTATTAPTTIDSSPKREDQRSKPEEKSKAETATVAERPVSSEHVVGGPAARNIHPTLHSALAKAKSLLNPPLYRSLEATASDALQLAAMTGSAGPQGTTFSAAAIINGVTVSDRHVRRKADTMCRNLTDLCLALCEGKHEAPSVVASPVTLSTPTAESPSLRYSRSSLGGYDNQLRSSSRPMSRLEARRTSILGSQRASSIGNSPSGAEEMSASEQENTPSVSRKLDVPRIERPASRLQKIRQQHYGDLAEDDDPTVRPLSRAMTDISRTRPSGPRDISTPQRSPGLRDSLAARRTNASAHEGNRELLRVASLSSDSGRSRRFHEPSTPPVLEEEPGGQEGEFQQSSASSLHNRRVMSLNRHAPRHTGGSSARTASLTQRRQVAVE